MKVKHFLVTLGLLFVTGCLYLAIVINDHPSVLDPDPEAPGAVLIENIRLVSMAPDAPPVETARSVLVVGDRIEAIDVPGRIKAPENALIVQGRGRTLLPGLIDAHVHVWDEAELAGYLAHGVTGIRNMSGMPFHIPLARRLDAGEILGPDFMTTGPILNSPGPNQQDNQQIVVTAEEARAAVQAQYEAGFRMLKFYSNLSRDARDAALEEARRLGMTYTGHSPEGVRLAGMPHDKPFSISFEESLGRGFQTIEHTESIVWHGLRDDPDQGKMRALAAKIAAAGDVVTPTLIAHDNLVRVAATKGAYLDRPGVDTVNPALRYLSKGDYEFWSSQDPAEYEAPRGEFYRTATRMMHEAGVTLVAGSDAGIFVNIPGAALTRELELLVRAGLTPHEALVTATRNSAEALGFGKTGIIAPGYRANLILVESDPLENISAVENPAAVMIGGYWLDQAAVEQMRTGAGETSMIRSLWRAAALLLSL
ncbi:amidohydrolase family protein [Emcibacter sp.]|uniref:amidohydrolase family protein n=1 Tax=Emcibacter sp. TaxID=1979954 RepID=UPI002AA7EE7F|nr:amidohydrolase family protein [Emcibacter sp.]